MKILFVTISIMLFLASIGVGQKEKAEPGFYPLGYSRDTWTGKVIDFSNELRTLTLSNKNGKNAETFIAVIPDAPYQWVQNTANDRVVDFPFDKKSDVQIYTYMGSGEHGFDLLPPGVTRDTERRKNPPAANVMSEFAQFKGRNLTVYYRQSIRTVNGQNENYNDVWRIKILKK